MSDSSSSRDNAIRIYSGPAPEEGHEAPGEEELSAKQPGFIWLDELAAIPVVKPTVILPRIALEGRMTLFAAEEKSGKSTLIGQGIAALTAGEPFLGMPTIAGNAVWMALDEPVDDCVGRLIEGGAAQHRVAIVEDRPSWATLFDILDIVRPTILVVDTLTEWAVHEIQDLNSAAQWTPILKKLRDSVCRQRGISVILLHHVKKGSTGYADSRAIGAGVDIIIEMRKDMADANRRYLDFRGRGIGAGCVRVRYVHGLYQFEPSAWS